MPTTASRKRYFASKKPSIKTTSSTTSKATKSTSERVKRKNKYGVTKIGRKTYSPEFRELSRQVKTERGNACEKCGSTNGLEVHHIIPISKGGKDERKNLILLCSNCHDRRHRHLRGKER